MKRKKISSTCIVGLALCFSTIQILNANDALKLQYLAEGNETTILDLTGNGYNGILVNDAAIKPMDNIKVLDLGSKNGYVDMQAKTGELISGLENFSMSTYICVKEENSLQQPGNFVWSFSNSTNMADDANGNMFFSAKNQRYAISKTHWQGEQGIELGNALPRGTWKHVTYVQNGTTGTLYIDGAVSKTGTISITPKELGKTPFNFLGRASYNSDAYLKHTLLYDFRIYSSALTAEEITELAKGIPTLNNSFIAQAVIDAKDYLVINNGSQDVRTDIKLPSELDNAIKITWTSSDENYITKQGKVTRPSTSEPVKTVTLTATLTKDGVSKTKDFTLNVLPLITDEESVTKDADQLVAAWQEWCVIDHVILASAGIEGSVITWKSNDTEYLSDNGIVLKPSPKGEGNKTVSMTATIKKGNASISKNFNVCILEDEGFSSYLFAYFTGNNGNEEAIRFAISRDGYNYKSLNNNQPIINSTEISDKGGVRDPHILRGADGKTFYMVVTDMKSADGWNSNHGIILLKSEDLANWTSSKIDIKATYPEDFGNIQSAWAPQSIYDPETKKYMIYWSMRSTTSHEIIYYAYANADFTAFESKPQILFNHPGQYSCIDGDIIYKNGEYHLFFKTEGASRKGIKKAVSKSLTSGYVIHDEFLEQTNDAVEGSCVFKFINQNKYILMYDVYMAGKYQFTESNDLVNFKVIDESVSMDFHPRHGTVIPITEEEGKSLMEKWGTAKEVEVISAASKAVKQLNYIKDEVAKQIFLPVRYGTDLTQFDPELLVLSGVTVEPNTPQDFTTGAVEYILKLNEQEKKYSVTAVVNNNAALEGYYADPEILYSRKTGKFHLYPTSDGFDGWGGYYFKSFSSDDLVNWTDEGVFLDLSTSQVSWANGNAWAPCIEEKMIDGEYKYFYYFSGNPVAGGAKQIGVAVADNPTGPFVDSGKPFINFKPAGVSGGQEIDPDVFTDPKTGKSYIYWGNGYMAGAELNDDMVSIKESTMIKMTPNSTFREGVYVFYRNDKYYFMWSEDDTGSENYKVRYGTSDSPLGKITIPANNIVIQKDLTKKIYATGHNSVIQIPGKDEWYIVYHRFRRPRLTSGLGFHREVCIDKLEFNTDGTIKPTTPTLEGISPVVLLTDVLESIKLNNEAIKIFPNPANNQITIIGIAESELIIHDTLGKDVFKQKINSENENIDISKLPKGIYIANVTINAQYVYHQVLIKN